MQVIDFLKQISGNLKIELPAELAEKLAVDLPETFDTEFTKNYLTRDRAKSDDEIITEITKKANKNALTAVDEQIKELLPLVSDEARQKINSVFSTAEKVKLLKPALDESMQKQKGKVTPEDVRKVEEEWSLKYKTLQDSAKAEKEQLARQMEEKNFDFYATAKISGYNVADQFKQTREQINSLALLALKQKGYTYEFENGTIAVRQVKDGIARDAFDGDKKVTFESLIDGFMQPFIAKSAGSAQGAGGDDTQQQQRNIALDGKEDLKTMMFKQQQAVSLP